MALVRCTCLVQMSTSARGERDVLVQVLDPECGYVPHRLGADLAGAADAL